MANLQETATWEAGIYQLEVTDPVLGGPDGVDNRAPRQLANRTMFLKGQVDGLRSSLQQTNTNVSNLGTSKEDKSTVAGLAARIAELERKSAVFAAGGGMVLWQKPANQIPVGWAEVVNWRGRLPMGWNPDDYEFSPVGIAGGSKTKQLSISEMPSHSHAVSNRSNSQEGSGKFTTGGDALEGPVLRTDNEGGGAAFSILNPYRVVVFIEYVG